MKKIYEGTTEDLGSVYQLMKEDFPQEEIRDLDQLKSAMDNERYKLYTLREKECKEIIGYAMVYEIDEPKSYWLDYLAVHSDCRNKGYGMKIINYILKCGQTSQGMFIEIEKADSEDETERILQEKRIKFYQRLGARKLDFQYRFPIGEGSIPLDLYFIPNEKIKYMKAEEIKKAIEITFTEIYNGASNWREVFSEFEKEIKDQSF